MNAPSFSVVIPTRNRPRLVTRAIRSVLAQTDDDFEVVVVDDGSSPPLSEADVPTEPRLRVLRREESGGAGAARNQGWRAASSARIVFLDDDDELCPGFLAAARRAFEEAGEAVGFGWTGSKVLDDDAPNAPPTVQPAWRPRFGSREAAYRGFLLSRRTGASGLIVTRDALEETGGFDERMTRAEDTDLLVRLARVRDFAVLDGSLKIVHAHSGPRMTAPGIENARSYEILLSKHIEAVRESRDLRYAFGYKLGWLYHHAGHRAEGRRHLMAAIRSAPWRFDAWVVLVLAELLGRRFPSIHRRISRWRSAGPRSS